MQEVFGEGEAMKYKSNQTKGGQIKDLNPSSFKCPKCGTEMYEWISHGDTIADCPECGHEEKVKP